MSISSGEIQPAAIIAPGLELTKTVSDLEKKLAHVATTLQKEAKTVAASALDLAKHPNHYAALGASIAEGMAGESLGELVGAGLGSLLGPEGTVIGAEVGGLIGQVFGARQGGKIAEALVHQPEPEAPLTEDLEKESSARAGSHLGEIMADMIGEALFDDAGGKIIEAIGDELGD